MLQAQKLEAIGRLTGGIAHDFNNMLTAIIGHAELALKGIGDESIRRRLEVICTSAERASRLVQQLLAFSRRQIMKPEVVNLNLLLKDMKPMLEQVIGEDISLVLKEADDLWNVLIDPSQMEQVIMNLAINARDAMPRGGTLTIETANQRVTGHRQMKSGEYVMVTVSDTGCGMTEEVMAHIFEPFYTTKGPDRGTGLGLSTVYGIVKQSGGYIFVHSLPGEGSRFTIYLPRYKGSDRKREEKDHKTETLPEGQERILLVEDHQGVRTFCADVLRGLGYEVIECSRPSEALQRCRDSTYHLLLTDVVMPEMSGTELATKIKETCPGIRVLYITGYSEEHTLRYGIERHMRLLKKPFSAAELARAVREALAS